MLENKYKREKLALASRGNETYIVVGGGTAVYRVLRRAAKRGVLVFLAEPAGEPGPRELFVVDTFNDRFFSSIVDGELLERATVFCARRRCKTADDALLALASAARRAPPKRWYNAVRMLEELAECGALGRAGDYYYYTDVVGDGEERVVREYIEVAPGARAIQDEIERVVRELWSAGNRIGPILYYLLRRSVFVLSKRFDPILVNTVGVDGAPMLVGGVIARRYADVEVAGVEGGVLEEEAERASGVLGVRVAAYTARSITVERGGVRMHVRGKNPFLAVAVGDYIAVSENTFMIDETRGEILIAQRGKVGEYATLYLPLHTAILHFLDASRAREKEIVSFIGKHAGRSACRARWVACAKIKYGLEGISCDELERIASLVEELLD